MGKLRPRKKKYWVPGETSSLCSAHFTEEDFVRPLNLGAVKTREEINQDYQTFPRSHFSFWCGTFHQRAAGSTFLARQTGLKPGCSVMQFNSLPSSRSSITRSPMSASQHPFSSLQRQHSLIFARRPQLQFPQVHLNVKQLIQRNMRIPFYSYRIEVRNKQKHA